MYKFVIYSLIWEVRIELNQIKIGILRLRSFNGAGGSEVDPHPPTASNRGACQPPGTSLRMKKSRSQPKLQSLQISKTHTITLRAQTPNATPKNQLQNPSSPTNLKADPRNSGNML